MKELKQMVKDECANFRRGDCIFPPCTVCRGEKCHVALKVLYPCLPTHKRDSMDYFGSCVVPACEHRPEYANAAAEYVNIAGLRNVQNLVRNCECGRPMEKRHKRCEECARKAAMDARKLKSRAK